MSTDEESLIRAPFRGKQQYAEDQGKNWLYHPQRFSAVLISVAFGLYYAVSTRFPGQWDSYDYLKQIVSYEPSPLGFGRPVFIGYNMLLWESMQAIFKLEPDDVEKVAAGATVLAGVLGVFLFLRLSGRLLPHPADKMAALAFAFSPVYALYSGSVMTEVPMLTALLASALILGNSGARHQMLRIFWSGALFGLAVGIREQALTLGPSLVWILWNKGGHQFSRLRCIAVLIVSSAVVILGPVVFLYFIDPLGFVYRIKTWFNAIPTGEAQFWNNVQASLLFVLALCMGAWLATAGAGIYHLIIRRAQDAKNLDLPVAISNPVSGFVVCLVVPLMVLWCDADVQTHVRYLLIVLPASVIVCVLLYCRWFASKNGPVAWAVIQVLVFAAAFDTLSPYRQEQTHKVEFARLIRESVPDKALLIAGNLSPILDYYRGIGLRPSWQVLWPGWNWSVKRTEASIWKAWEEGIPVFLSTNASGWRYFESEFLDLHFLLKNSTKEQFAPMLYRLYPPGENKIRNRR